ncbi:MAG: cytochrome c oxidase subunit II [Candidatus Kapaibacterium sp.]|jgi:cytochrome c oxidase subunit 2
MFEQTSRYSGTVDSAMLYITVISVLMLLLVTVAMIYFVIRYRASKNPIPTPYHGNTAIEVTWIVIPTILVMSMFYYGYKDFADLRNTKEFDEEISVTAKMWDWDFKYENGTVTDTLYVPVGKTLKFNITSIDVLHSFYIPAFRIKQDAVPGRNEFVVITPEKTGVYDIACAEYCGVNHWNMYKKFVVMEQDDYYAWIESQGSNNKEEVNTTEEKSTESESNEMSENSNK